MGLSRFAPVLMFIGLTGVAIAGRLLPHMENAAPVAAVALFSGFYFRRLWIAVLPPLLAMGVSDYFLENPYSTPLMLTVYAGLCLPAVLGKWFVHRAAALQVGAVSLAGSCLFFLATNFMVWKTSSWYSPDFSGLLTCYWAAIPFFRNTLLGDLMWNAVFFGVYAATTYRVSAASRQKLEARQASQQL